MSKLQNAKDILKGKNEKIWGKLTGDQKQQAKGIFDQLKGNLKNTFEDGQSLVKDGSKKITKETKSFYKEAKDQTINAGNKVKNKIKKNN
ncbi:CsbD family protein [Fructilactobacillus vespulae]|uniref:CsbD family protein n=1 Tax=Fructilactobacillus vespulae TaxID=1249630 RepID=UPI0039B4C040